MRCLNESVKSELFSYGMVMALYNLKLIGTSLTEFDEKRVHNFDSLKKLI